MSEVDFLSLQLVVIGGFFGAIFRYLIAKRMSKRFQNYMPYGTLTVNLVGSFFLGVVIAKDVSNNVLLLAGTGFLGAFTTFSTLHVELMQMLLKYEWVKFIVYSCLTYGLGLVAFAFGFEWIH